MFRQFDVVKNPGRKFARQVPYVVVLQHDILHDAPLVVVAPLWRRDCFTSVPPLSRFAPEFIIEGESVMLSILELAPVPRRELKNLVASLEGERLRLTDALGLLFHGF